MPQRERRRERGRRPRASIHALADQDDAWYPAKLATRLDAIGEAQLVYSDMRIIGRGGEEIAASYWERRRNNHTDLTSLLVANAVTGAASLFRRELLDYALPFPPDQFAHYHDHWLALTALVRGRFCELAVREVHGATAGELFTLGMFSVIDALMDAPMEEVLA